MKDDEPLGEHPDTGHHIFVKTGRFGPYVEMRPKEDKKEKKKTVGKTKKRTKTKYADLRRASIPPGTDLAAVTLEHAVKYLSLPRDLGEHPESGKQVVAGTGRFGPFIVHDGDFRSLKGGDNPYDITHGRALEILKEPKKGRKGVEIVREVGEHPRTKKKIYLYKSKSGHFLKRGFKHIPVPEAQVDNLTAAEAADLLKAS